MGRMTVEAKQAMLKRMGITSHLPPEDDFYKSGPLVIFAPRKKAQTRDVVASETTPPTPPESDRDTGRRRD